MVELEDCTSMRPSCRAAGHGKETRSDGVARSHLLLSHILLGCPDFSTFSCHVVEKRREAYSGSFIGQCAQYLRVLGVLGGVKGE